MEYEFDKTKYFLDPNKKKIYAGKGQMHKGLAYNILSNTGLDMLYFSRYEEFIPAALFLTYCGYVLVDEGEGRIKHDLFEDKVTKFTSVCYCSAAIDEGYIEYLRKTYGNSENILDDGYQTDNIKLKDKIDEIIKEVRERQKEKQQDDER